MTPDRRFRFVSIAPACVAAAVLLALPSFANATEIAWSAERLSATMASGKRTTESQAAFKNGDKARVHSECEAGPYDSKGWITMNCEADFTFTDGSHIYLTVQSQHDEKTLIANSTGTFKGGTKRFEGITGSATGVGLTGRMQWTGTYTVPGKK